MSREIRQRWELTGALVAETPLRVGDTGGAAGSLLTQARDGLHRPLLPGTSLAGAIRAALPKDEADHALWGKISGTRTWRAANDGSGQRDWVSADDGTGEASWVSVHDAHADAAVVPEQRDSTAIDRFTGAAARGFLFTQEILPIGTAFEFRLSIDDPTSEQNSPARTLIDRITALLRAGLPLGAGTSRGLGRVRLCDAALQRWDLGTRAGMLRTLRGESTMEQPVEPAPLVGPDVLRIRIPWRPTGPVMVRVATDTAGVSAVPLTGTMPNHNGEQRLRLLIPGSSIKGALRAHAERILRTQANAGTVADDVAAQLHDATLAPAHALFGTAKNNDGKDSDPSTSDGAGANRRGALTAHECHNEHELPPDIWADLARPKQKPTNTTAGKDRWARREFAKQVTAANARLSRPGGQAGLRFVVANHVAVDRWTGGAAESRLFAVLEPEFAATGDTGWAPITLEINLRRLGDDAAAALRLLLFVLRDLTAGWLGLGYGTTRGMGALHVDAHEITFTTGAGTKWSFVDGRTLADVLAEPGPLADDPTGVHR